MENPVLEDIKKYAINKLKSQYGYCGVAEGWGGAIINSSDSEGYGIEIKISVSPACCLKIVADQYAEAA